MGRILSAAKPDSGRDATIRRIAIAVVVLVFLGLLGFSLLSWRAAIAPIERPNPASFAAESIAKGEVLAAEGHCVSCHIRPGGQPFAGGYGVNTPFGIIYGSNITPDPKTGIGGWSLEAFTRAMREGVSRNGSHLFAAFPFNAYTELQDDDVEALYAYLMTRPAVNATVPPMTVPFPLNVRFLQEGWKILCFRSGRYRPDPAKDAQWNRGAYLAQAVSDCGGCHTPRNALGGENLRDAYAGTVVAQRSPGIVEINTDECSDFGTRREGDLVQLCASIRYRKFFIYLRYKSFEWRVFLSSECNSATAADEIRAITGALLNAIVVGNYAPRRSVSLTSVPFCLPAEACAAHASAYTARPLPGRGLLHL